VSRYASSAASALIGAGLCAVAFGGGGGFDLSSLTRVDVEMLAAGALLVALAVLRGRGGRIDGGGTLLAFGGLALLSALSVLWSVAPHQSWVSADNTIAYVALFAAGVAVARLRPDGVAIVLRGIVLAAGAVVLYALITRVFPSLARDEVFARLGQPYGYWNALGTTAALAVPATLWLGARRSGHQPVNAVAYPLLSLVVVTLFLSYSRGAVIAAGIGAALWLAFVPLRLRSVILLGVSLAGAAPVIVWALAQDAFTKTQVSHALREAIAPEFGLWLLATTLVMLGAGLAIGFRVARRPPRARARLRAGTAAAMVALVVPVLLFVVLASSDRGLGGTISQGYESLTSISKKTPGGPGRLLTASSSRGLYWHQAKEVFLGHYWKGTGADTFGVSRLRYRAATDQSVSQHAHGYIQQTAADLGTIGLAVSLVLLIAWLVAARRATGLFRRDGPSEWSAERIGVVALALSAFVYGLHSAVDWVWFVPGPTAMGLLAAGFVAGRGPLSRREAPVVAGTPAPPPPPPPPPRASWRRYARPLLAALTLVVAGLCIWATWQPLRSDNLSDHALDLAANGRIAAARAAAKRAHDIDPLASRPYVVLSAVDDAGGNQGAAVKALEDAVRAFPGDPQTWLQLAQYQLNSLSKPADALQTIQAALYLDPQSRAAQTVFFQASTALNPVPAPAPVVAPTPVPAPTPTPTPTITQPRVPTAPAPPAPPATGGTKAPG
jgi:hypothetical protein